MSQTGNNRESDIPLEFQERVAQAKAKAKAQQEARLVAEQQAEIARQKEREKINNMGRWAAQMLREARVPYDALLPIETTLIQRIVLFWEDPMYPRERGMRGWQLFKRISLADNDSRDEKWYDVILDPDGTPLHRINGVEWTDELTKEHLLPEWRRHRNDEIEQALIELVAEKT